MDDLLLSITDAMALTGHRRVQELERLREIVADAADYRVADLLGHVDAVIAGVLADDIHPSPTVAEAFERFVDGYSAGLPNKEMMDLRYTLRHAGPPDSPEWLQATEMLRHHRRITCEQCGANRYISRDRRGAVCDDCPEAA